MPVHDDDIIFSPISVAQVLLLVRGRRVGRSEGVRRGLHASVVRLHAVRPPLRALSPLCEPPSRPVALGPDGRVPGARALHLDLCRLEHHGAAAQRQRRDCHHGPRQFGREASV
jgi:hypothetical protein